MIKVKLSYLFICLTFAFGFCKGQTVDKILLEKIIFHSSRCNGSCPSLDPKIDSSRKIFVNRKYYKTKSGLDKRFSGQFSGSLDQSKYNKLIELLQNCSLDVLQFPAIICCDAPIITIIVYYNGDRKYFKSMTPPRITNELISFLKTIGNDKELIKTNETRIIEE